MGRQPDAVARRSALSWREGLWGQGGHDARRARGGGDFISYSLVELSTGYDYVKGMIEVALNLFTEPEIKSGRYAGVYFLSKNTAYLKEFIVKNQEQNWVVDFEIQDEPLQELKKSQDRTGHIIYQADNKIEISTI